jgi:hypothetical protein
MAAMPCPANWSFLVLALSASSSLALQQQDTTRRHSGLAGVVRDSLRRPITAASVLVDGTSVFTATDDSGRFDVRGLPAGRNGFTNTKIGFAPLSFEVSLPSDSVILLAVTMHPVQLLNAVNVTAERTNVYLARTGFTERRQLGIGSFLTPQHIDSIAMSVTRPSELLRGVRGIDMRCGTGPGFLVGADCNVYSHRPPGCLWLFIDGVPHGEEQIDQVGLPPGGVAAIEVYERPSMVPLKFQGQLPIKKGANFSMAAGCGALVIWTKSRVP